MPVNPQDLSSAQACPTSGQRRLILPDNTLNRREAMGLAGAGLAGTLLFAPAACSPGRIEVLANAPPLRLQAARRGLDFGCAVRTANLRDPAYAAAVAREAALIVPENEMKWLATERVQGQPDYRAAEEIAAFAAAHHLHLRGHTAFWYGSMPDWAKAAMAGPSAHAVMLKRVTDIVSHFRGRVSEWDVVNEVVEPKDGMPRRLRRAPFNRPVEYQWFADCFHAAHAADPQARLFYNEYFVEGATEFEEQRRIGVLDFLTAMKQLGAPIHGFGTQSHIAVGRALAPARYGRFLADVAALGLEIRATEFDVGDYKVAADIPLRDQKVAAYARDYLDTVLAQPATRGVLTWGLRDQDSWIQTVIPRPDGLPERPLPLDDELRRKPLWAAIGDAFMAAPARPARAG